MKPLNEMTVDELSKGLICINMHNTGDEIKDKANRLDELKNRAKLAEQQPKWKLTQILLELERAGLPEPYLGLNGFCWGDSEDIKLDFCSAFARVSYCDSFGGVRDFLCEDSQEITAKLKELLCGK